MKYRFVAVELTLRYKESATKLGNSDPNIHVQLDTVGKILAR